MGKWTERITKIIERKSSSGFTESRRYTGDSKQTNLVASMFDDCDETCKPCSTNGWAVDSKIEMKNQFTYSLILTTIDLLGDQGFPT